jgi:hypothetical protein
VSRIYDRFDDRGCRQGAEIRGQEAQRGEHRIGATCSALPLHGGFGHQYLPRGRHPRLWPPADSAVIAVITITVIPTSLSGTLHPLLKCSAARRAILSGPVVLSCVPEASDGTLVMHHHVIDVIDSFRTHASLRIRTGWNRSGPERIRLESFSVITVNNS